MESEQLERIANDDALLEVGRKAIEEMLRAYRDNRTSEPYRGNGLVIKEANGMDSHIIRCGPEHALHVGLMAIAEHLRKHPTSTPRSAGC